MSTKLSDPSLGDQAPRKLALGNVPSGFYSETKTIEILFPDPAARPSSRTWARWKARKLFSMRKVGRLVFFDPAEVRLSIDRHFTIQGK